MRYAMLSKALWKTVRVVEIFVLVSLIGCAGQRVIMIPPGEPVRLRETIRGAKVWVADKNGREIEAVVDLMEGWYALPDPGPEK